MLARLRLLSQHFPTLVRTMSTTTFHHPSTHTPIYVPSQLSRDLTQDAILSFPAFKTWFNTLNHSLSIQEAPTHPFHKNPYELKSIEVQAADFFGGGSKLGFLKLKADVSTKEVEKGGSLPRSVFLRGGSAAMLVILQPDDASNNEEYEEAYVVLTVQPRVPAGSLEFVELPAGMLDDSGTFAGGAAKELKEEVGIEVKDDELIDLTSLAVSALSETPKEQLQKALYPSPGGSDEFIPIFLHRRKLRREQLKEWEGRLTGLRDEGEKITLRLCKLRDLWKVGVRDGKTLAAWGLFEGLRRDGKI